MISSKIWTELGKPRMDGKLRHLEAYASHQSKLPGSSTCIVEWNGSRHTKTTGSLIKNLDFLADTFYPSTVHLPAVKGSKAHVKLIPGSQPIFCKARQIPLPLQDKVTEKLK